MEHGYFIFAAHFPATVLSSMPIQYVEKEKRRRDERMKFYIYKTHGKPPRVFPWKQKLGVVWECGRNWVRTTENRELFHLASFLHADVAIGTAVSKLCLPYSWASPLATYANPDANRARTFSFTVRSFSTNSDRNLDHQSHA